eukprot:TRINITY_DN23172_c0_g1_i1.p1 TRINITY_DN23172_c0_g1~~TRINITY_DN23172_c0_g1_i1.p1  ORF type:complete len:148 (-),score=18.28 TRINITY_DN23172_c0_g1_i1:153-596(-)
MTQSIVAQAVPVATFVPASVRTGTGEPFKELLPGGYRVEIPRAGWYKAVVDGGMDGTCQITYQPDGTDKYYDPYISVVGWIDHAPKEAIGYEARQLARIGNVPAHIDMLGGIVFHAYPGVISYRFVDTSISDKTQTRFVTVGLVAHE